jgi:integrase
MSTDTTVSPLRQRMIEDMAARKLGRHAQRSHIHSCRRFAAFLGRSPDTATADDVRRFQLHLVESGLSICNRNRIMTGVRFLFRVTLRRHDLAAEVYHLKEPQKLPLVMSPEEAKRLLAMSGNLKVHVMLALGYGCGLRAGEIVRLRAGDIDSAQMIIRIVQGKGRKSLPSRKRGTAMRCCRRSCSNCCAPGGARGGGAACCCPEAGCFQAATRSSRCRPGNSAALSAPPPRPRGSRSACRRTRCGTALPRTSSSKMSIFA